MAALADHRGRQWQFCALQRKNLKLELSDFLHVTDWQLVEGGLHRDFHKKRVQGLDGARELLVLLVVLITCYRHEGAQGEPT
jgi:hypothetical protein